MIGESNTICGCVKPTIAQCVLDRAEHITLFTINQNPVFEMPAAGSGKRLDVLTDLGSELARREFFATLDLAMDVVRYAL